MPTPNSNFSDVTRSVVRANLYMFLLIYIVCTLALLLTFVVIAQRNVVALVMIPFPVSCYQLSPAVGSRVVVALVRKIIFNQSPTTQL